MNQNSTLPRWLIFLLATSVGVIAANIYYAQPLVRQISHSLGIEPSAAGLVVTLTQLGYGFGVLFIVPLGDLIENRRIVIAMIGVTLLGLVGLAFAREAITYFIAAFATGLGASGVQVIVPYAAHLAPEKERGRVVGTLMSGLMIGIMLSRPSASFMTDLISWHAIFIASAVLMIFIGAALYKLLPPRQPEHNGLKYKALLNSMWHLYLNTPVLRRRALYQSCLFGAFCLFWTASPLYLLSPAFHFSQSAIAVFALVGVSGAVCAPLAGRLADKGWTKSATFVAISISALSFLITLIFEAGSTASFVLLTIGAIVLDAGITANLVLGQRAIFSLAPHHRSRLNALYMATIFVGGGIGSSPGAWPFEKGGWSLAALCGCGLPTLALLVFLTEPELIRRARTHQNWAARVGQSQ